MKSLIEITFLLILLGAVQLPAADSTNETTSTASITITATPTSAENASHTATSNSTATYSTVSSTGNASNETENMNVSGSTTSAAEGTNKTTLSSNNTTTHTVGSTATVYKVDKTTTHPGKTSNPITSPCSDFPTLMTVVVAAAIFCVLWSSITCICYRRKLSQLQKEKSHWDAENGTLKHDVNGRKISVDHFSGGKILIDKDPSSVSRNIHSELEKEGVDLDRTSDLYDVTDPDYEVADKETHKKPSQANEDDIIEDSEYDLLNDDDKVKRRESDYACAEFRTSNMDLDCDTYDTTETFNRIKCAEKNENSEETTSTKDRLNEKSNEKDNTPESKEGVTADTISDKETSNQKEPEEKTAEKVNKMDEAATMMPSDNDIKLQKPSEKAPKLEINSNTKVSTFEYELVQIDEDQSETVPKEKPEKTSMTNMETTSTKDRLNEESNVKDSTPKSKKDINADTVSDKGTSNQKEPEEKPAEKVNKMDEAATIMPSDNDIKLQKPCEKAPKLEINSNTKASTFEYELVQIVEDQSETVPKEKPEKTSMTNVDEK